MGFYRWNAMTNQEKTNTCEDCILWMRKFCHRGECTIKEIETDDRAEACEFFVDYEQIQGPNRIS